MVILLMLVQWKKECTITPISRYANTHAWQLILSRQLHAYAGPVPSAAAAALLFIFQSSLLVMFRFTSSRYSWQLAKPPHKIQVAQSPKHLPRAEGGRAIVYGVREQYSTPCIKNNTRA